MDRYLVPLENSRSLTLAADQLRRLAKGLGDHFDRSAGPSGEPPIVAAMRVLPPNQRADAWAVALLRFAEKQDVESIAHTCGLSPWRVWQLEEAFRQALVEVSTVSPPVGGALVAGYAG